MSFVPQELTPDFKSGEEYLAKRGITKQIARDCYIEFRGVTELSTKFTNGFGRCGLEFPYYDIHRVPMDYSTVRWIDRTGGRMQLVGGKELGKLGTPKDQPIRPYFPLINDWSQIGDGARVYFHESVLKSINGAALGKYSIGLNGVRGFAAAKHNLPLLPEIESLPWRELNLQPVIVFDSNWRNNRDVQLAETRLAGALIHRVPGIVPPIALHLPPHPDDTDWGFDDARAFHGDKWAKEFLEGIGETVDASELNAAIVELNDEVVWVHETHSVMHMAEGHSWTSAVFVKGAYSNRVVYVPTANGQGVRPVSVAEAWMKWHGRNEVHRAVYEPGQPRIKVPEFFNVWDGMGCEPEEGSVALFLEVLQNNIRDERVRDWLIQWLAFPIQNLGAKLMTNLVLVGPPGTGKSWLCEMMGRIYGRKNYIEIGREDLDSSFNSHYVTKQFVNLNEVTRASSRSQSLANNNKLKLLTTSPTLNVNRKGIPQWVTNNHINLVITTNYADGLFLDEQDRRSAVIHWEPVVSRVNDRAYWERLWGWPGGAKALYDFLLSVNMHGFDPSGWAPWTEAKHEMIESARTGWEVWVIDLARNPDEVLSSHGRCLYTNKELRTLCAETTGELVDKVPQIAFGTQLKAHFKKANGGGKVKIEGLPEVYYIIKGGEADFDTHDKCKRHLLQHRIR